MPHVELLWTPENIAHIAEHGVTPEEVESVLSEPLSTTISRKSGNLITFGYTEAGRKLAVLYEKIDDVTLYPLTAYDVE